MPEGAAAVAASVPRAWAAASVPPTLGARAWATAASGPPAGISAGRADRSQAIRITGMVATWAGAPPGLEPRPWQGRTITTITTTAPTTTARPRITAAAPT